MGSKSEEKRMFIVVEDSPEKRTELAALLAEKESVFVTEDFLEEFPRVMNGFRGEKTPIVILDEILDERNPYESESGVMLFVKTVFDSPNLAKLKGVVVCNSSGDNEGQSSSLISFAKITKGCNWSVSKGPAVTFLKEIEENPEYLAELLNENLPNSETNVEYNNRN